MLSQFAWFFLSLRGRISRQEFWLGYIFTIAISFPVVRVLQNLSLGLRRPLSGTWYRDELDFALLLPKLVAAAIIIWPLMTLYVKRLHDLGFSGWWLLAFIAVLSIASAVGLDTKSYVGLAMLAVAGLVPAKRGDNRFGRDLWP